MKARSFGLGVAFAALLGTLGASAQSEAPSPKVSASVQLGLEGRELFERRQYAAAHERFVLAERLTHSPVFTLHIARCLRHLGKLLAAREEYARTAAEPLAPDAPAPWASARSDAQAELAQLERELPVLQWTFVGTEPHEVVLEVDDAPVSRDDLRLDPGRHRVVARRRGEVRSWQVELRAGSKVRLEIRFGALDRPKVGPAVPAASSDDARPSLRPWAWVGVGAAGLGLGLGITAGAIAWSTRNGLDCEGTRCSPVDEPSADRARLWADLATAGFVVGGVGAVAGAALFWLEPTRPRPGAALALLPTPGGITCTGRF